MKHYGDITKLSGYELPPVDCVCGGSPCQDLSVAGLRAGLDGERSGLFMEQIRIVKELRENDRAVRGANVLTRPRFMVWENVVGATASNSGRDFQTVLTEIIRIADENAPVVPMPEGGGGQNSGVSTTIWEDGQLLTAFTPRSFGESPNVAVESRLSQILTDSAHPKYYLSARACQGILNRAQKRGKELPPELKAALEKQAKDIGKEEFKR